MNTEQEPKPGTRSSLPALQGDFAAALGKTTGVTKIDDAAATLEFRLQREADLRREERFGWIFAISLLADALVFPNLGWSVVPVFLLQVVFLIFMARWLGIDAVVILLERIFDKYIAHNSHDSDRDNAS